MPPARRLGPSAPRPFRRPRVAGSRDVGPDGTPPDDGPELEPEPAVADTESAAREESGAGPGVVIRKVPLARPPETPDDLAILPTPAPSRPRGPRLAAAMMGLTVLVGVFAVVAYFEPGVAATGVSNTAFVDAAATGEVAAAAINAVQKTYSYSYGTIDSDLTAATDLMTPEMATQHKENIATIKDAVGQAKTTSKAKVTADGVRTLQGDRAEVVAFVVVTSDNGGTALAPVPLRFTAQMLRVGGTWKLAGLVPA